MPGKPPPRGRRPRCLLPKVGPELGTLGWRGLDGSPRSGPSWSLGSWGESRVLHRPPAHPGLRAPGPGCSLSLAPAATQVPPASRAGCSDTHPSQWSPCNSSRGDPGATRVESPGHLASPRGVPGRGSRPVAPHRCHPCGGWGQLAFSLPHPCSRWRRLQGVGRWGEQVTSSSSNSCSGWGWSGGKGR